MSDSELKKYALPIVIEKEKGLLNSSLLWGTAYSEDEMIGMAYKRLREERPSCKVLSVQAFPLDKINRDLEEAPSEDE